jgi:hypothetical protein
MLAMQSSCTSCHANLPVHSLYALPEMQRRTSSSASGSGTRECSLTRRAVVWPPENIVGVPAKDNGCEMFAVTGSAAVCACARVRPCVCCVRVSACVRVCVCVPGVHKEPERHALGDIRLPEDRGRYGQWRIKPNDPAVERANE